MKRWRLLEKKRKYWYNVAYRMDKAKDGISLNFFTGNCSICDNKKWGDVDHNTIGELILKIHFSDKYKDYTISISMVSKL